MSITIKEYKNELNDQISKEIMAIRVPHTKATSESAMKIAERYGKVNKFDLHAACVLHDIAKELPYDTMVKIILNARNEEWFREAVGDIELNEFESIKWLHGIVGAIVAHDIYGITSMDVLQAIRYHKVGNIHDKPFTQILIAADNANELRKARYMISAYSTLKMHKFELSSIYEDIVKHDAFVAITTEDVVIPRMIQGQNFKENLIRQCEIVNRLGDYYVESAELIWIPILIDGEWKRVNADGVYVTPNGFENAALVMDNINHFHPQEIVLTLSEKDWNTYMISIIDNKDGNRHMVISFNDAKKSGVRLPRGYYPPKPTRYYSIDPGSLQ